MKYTSAQAAKLLSKLQQDYDGLLSKEQQSKSFLASVGEDVESVRPDYEYVSFQKELSDLETKIRKIKHEINRFNISTEIPGFGMTVDEMLVYIPQLTKKKAKLREMAGVLPKTRDDSFTGHMGSIIDYRYANYDIDTVSEDLSRVTEELSKAQLALDEVNHSGTIEIDI